MSPSEWMSIVACAGHLTLAVLVLARRREGPVALPLGLLTLDLFGWNFASFAYARSGAVSWHYVDRALSPFTPALTLHFVCAFVGKARPLRGVLVAAYLAFGSLAFWIDHDLWVPLFLVGVGERCFLRSGFFWCTWCEPTSEKSARARVSSSPPWRFSVLLGSSDLWNDRVSFPMPALSSLGTLAGTAITAAVALRFRLLGKELSSNTLLLALGVSAIAVFGYLAVFEWLGRGSVVALGALTAALAVGVAVREVRHETAIRRQRSQQLVTMGRFAQQLAHDLKNPLSALSGADSVSRKERSNGRSIDAHAEFLDLMAQQVTRLRGVVDDYERIARVEAVPMPLAVNDLVRTVLSLQPFAAREGIRVTAQLSEGLPECNADRDLLAAALENLLRNAFEAMPNGGTVTVRTGASPEPAGVEIAVEDEGIGMDARQLAHAFDDFFTTKATGTGLGLAFVQRVARAHGGAVSLTSRVGRGTVVRVQIPARGT